MVKRIQSMFIRGNDTLFNFESMRAFDVFVPTLYRRRRERIVREKILSGFLFDSRRDVIQLV